MNKKNQRQGKNMNTLYNYFQKSVREDKSILQTVRKIECKKKPLRKKDDSLPQQERSESLPIFTKKNTIAYFAKEVSIQQLFFKCPKLAEISIKIQQSLNLRKCSVNRLLKKYIQSNTYSLWSDKYAPNDCSELFNIKVGEKIRDWFQAFFQYKNKLCDYSDRYLCDFQEQKPCQIYKKIRQNKWKLEALVIRGRPGIGKSSAIKAIAEQLQIEWQECGNHFNPTKYLKQKNESTQSESVKTAISRRIKLQKNAQMITKYLPAVENEKATEPITMKCQIIHHVGSIYPESQSAKFYAELNRCIQLSKIPFVMTDVELKLPNQCLSYDQIQFKVGQTKDLEEVFWIIYHIEKNLQFNTTLLIEKQNLFDEINKQLKKIQLKLLVSIQKIHEICCIFNYHLDKIFTFLEFQDPKSADLRVLISEKYSNLTQNDFLESIPYFDFQNNDCIEMVLMSNLSIQIFQDSNSQGQLQKQKIFLKELAEFKRKMIFLRNGHNIGDYIYINYRNQSQLSNESFYQGFQYSGSIHKQVKKRLTKKANDEINIYYDKNRSTLKPNELQFLPMLMRKTPQYRKDVQKDPYENIFNLNQCIYIKRYGNFINKTE